MVRHLLNRLLRRGAKPALQDQVDTVTSADLRTRTVSGGGEFGNSIWDPPAETKPESVPSAHSAGGMVGTLIAGMSTFKGLNQLAEQLVNSRSWLAQLDQLAGELPAETLISTIGAALASLPTGLRRDLTERLAFAGVADAGDDAETIAGILRHGNGFEGLLAALVPSVRGEAGAPPNLMAAMKDPLGRDLAQTLILGMINARQEIRSASGKL